MKIAIIGAGPAGLMAAETLAHAGADVTVYDQKQSAGRKFLLAGRGGLNLTHSEALPDFMHRYGAAATRLTDAIASFPPDAVRQWSAALGEETFVGTSGRVFPKSFKASPLLRAWRRRLDDSGVRFAFQHKWDGWDKSAALRFDSPAGEMLVHADAVLLALGGASWPRLGSDGQWVDMLRARGVAVAPWKPANCGFVVPWSENFRQRFAGQPLKPVTLHFGGASVKGEIMLTATGIEGGAVYALSGLLRDAIEQDGSAMLKLDLRPDVALETLTQRLARPRARQSLSSFMRKAAGVEAAAFNLLRESAGSAIAISAPGALAGLLKALPLTLTATAGLDRAISTAGGIAFNAIDERFMLKNLPGVFVAGEMLDWEGPTGGYLLQGAFSTGAAAARGMLAWLADRAGTGHPPEK